jgi:hypothetical protein
MGRQKYAFLPYPESDFIFAVVGEDLGLIGCMSILALFGAFVFFGLRIAIRCEDRFGSLLAGGITCMIGVQCVLNVAVVIGMMPTTGLPLPFFSAGGTSISILMGAVAILMERETHTINGLSLAITGFGRVAKALATLLVAMGAHVTIGARRESALQEARALGCDTVRLCGEASMLTLVRDKAAVFNTIPHWIFTHEVLAKMPCETLLIDLASAPGGVDGEAARGLSRPVIFALSLPGKYAPDTAGEIIAQTVLSLLEREVRA